MHLLKSIIISLFTTSHACKITFWGLLGLIISSLSNLLLSLKCFLWLAIFSSSFLTSLKDLTTFIPTSSLVDARSRQSSTNEVSMLRSQHSRWKKKLAVDNKLLLSSSEIGDALRIISRSRIQDPIPIVLEHKALIIIRLLKFGNKSLLLHSYSYCYVDKWFFYLFLFPEDFSTYGLTALLSSKLQFYFKDLTLPRNNWRSNLKFSH